MTGAALRTWALETARNVMRIALGVGLAFLVFFLMCKTILSIERANAVELKAHLKGCHEVSSIEVIKGPLDRDSGVTALECDDGRKVQIKRSLYRRLAEVDL